MNASKITFVLAALATTASVYAASPAESAAAGYDAPAATQWAPVAARKSATSSRSRVGTASSTRSGSSIPGIDRPSCQPAGYRRAPPASAPSPRCPRDFGHAAFP